MRISLWLQLVLLLAMAGCSTSVEVEDFKPAQGPQGVEMEVTLNGNILDGKKVAGELLAVRDDGVLLSVPDYPGSAGSGNTIVLIPFWMMDTAYLEQMGRAKVESQGEESNEIHLARLRLVSRFPQGLSDELLAELLTKLNQDRVVVPHKTE